MIKKEKTKKPKESYEKPQLKKIYSMDQNRFHPLETTVGSGGACSCIECLM